MERPLRVLELYCGIGGCAAALGKLARVVAAVDIDRDALAVYRTNFPHPTQALTIESIPVSTYRDWNADVWWLSPPCQPYTVRGRRRDLDDPRAQSFQIVRQRVEAARPDYLALENVAGFLGSRAHGALREVLERCGYRVAEHVMCPTEIGVPNRRPRFYLVASRRELAPWPAWRVARRPIADHLDPSPPPQVFVPSWLIEKYWAAVDVIHPDSADAVTCCFTSAYGRSAVRSGSYLYAEGGIRRFTPREVLRFLGFPSWYRLPPTVSLRRGWALAGNSLAIDVVRWVLSAIPDLRDALAPHSQ
jgi:site-specific DNA-cytosine methylase